MRRFSMILPLWVACVWLCLGRAVEAQGYVPQYQPATPTISPYLDLFRRDGGPLPNYYTFVRPRLEAQQMFRQQGTRLQQQNTEIQTLQSSVSQMRATPGGARPTGTNSRFMDYSHYYNSGGGAGTIR